MITCPRLTFTPVVLLAGLFGAGQPARAQVEIGPAGPVRAEPVGHDDESLRTIFMVVDPAAEPSPALRYSFKSAIADETTGNAAPFYYRAFSLMSEAPGNDRDTLMKYLGKPPAELKAANLGAALAAFDDVFREVQTASLRETCNWEWRMKDLNGMEAVEFLLPEMQRMRELGRLLAVKAGCEIGNGEYEQAVHTLRQGYQLAMNAGQPRSLISSLVGIAIASMMNEQVIELMMAPDSPNLYWALAELPRPLVSIDRALELELSWPEKIFPFFRDAETVDRTPQEWRRHFQQATAQLAQFYEIVGQNRSELLMTGLMMRGYARAKTRLADEGFSRDELERMPAAQVIAIYQARVNRRLRDEIRKWSLLPYHLAWERQDEADRLVQSSDLNRADGEIIPIASLLFPAISASRRAEARCWTHLNFLQALEAVRMQAADNNGQLPDSLDDVNVVPVPLDPMTLKPFDYKCKGNEAVLEIPGIPGRRSDGRMRMTIRLRE